MAQRWYVIHVYSGFERKVAQSIREQVLLIGLSQKVKLAQVTFAAAGVGDVVTLISGDAREHLAGFTEISFCFLDAEKDIYDADQRWSECTVCEPFFWLPWNL